MMKTTWELRKDKKLDIKQNPDSLYKDILRPERKFASLLIPKNLENALPFKSKVIFEKF